MALCSIIQCKAIYCQNTVHHIFFTTKVYWGGEGKRGEGRGREGTGGEEEGKEGT